MRFCHESVRTNCHRAVRFCMTRDSFYYEIYEIQEASPEAACRKQ